MPSYMCENGSFCVVQRLRGQVSSLKASRDKLLVEVDRQSLENERLLTDNAALEQVPNMYSSRMLLPALDFCTGSVTLQVSACCELQQRLAAHFVC